MMLTKKEKKAISQRKIEITRTDLIKIVTDHCYDTIETLSQRIRTLQGKRIDTLEGTNEEPQTINDWMQNAVSQCLWIIDTSYDDVGKNIRNKFKSNEL